MMLLAVLENSIVLSPLRTALLMFMRLLRYARGIFLYSFSYEIFLASRAVIIVCFKYSFICRFTEIHEKTGIEILGSSRSFNFLRDNANVISRALFRYSSSSTLISFVKEAKGDFAANPIRATGACILVATLSNLVLLIFLHKHIQLIAWFQRAAFFCVGVAALFCKANFDDVRNDSFFLRSAKTYFKDVK